MTEIYNVTFPWGQTRIWHIINLQNLQWLDFEVQIEIIKNDISDHFGISCVLSTTLEIKNINKCITQRDLTESSVEILKELDYSGTKIF